MIDEFLKDAPKGTRQVLNLLAVAESLTDVVAAELYELSPVENVRVDAFLAALHQSSFIQPRNSEWNFEPRTRQALIFSEAADPSLVRQAHSALLAHTYDISPELAGTIIPNYLSTVGARAYHLAGVGDVAGAISSYGVAASHHYSGAQWLALRLADEQERLGILPADQSELLFLRAITLFREGKRKEALPLFERVVKKDVSSLPTAMALDILGNMLARTDPARSESLLRRGIAMSRAVGNELGVAIGEHNLGKLIGANARHFDEAEQLLNSSIHYGDSYGNVHHAAQARHSLGYLLLQVRFRTRAAEAEEVLRRSIADLESVGDRGGAGQAMHTLALLVKRFPDRFEEVETLYRRSIQLGEQVHDDDGVAMRLSTFGRELAKHPERRKEARATLARARAILSALGKKRAVERIDLDLAGLDDG